MISLQSDSFGWTDGADGLKLTVRTPQAKVIAERVQNGKQYTVEIKEYRQKRSLDQNAMYWSVLTTFAKDLGISNNYAHNMMLRRYGQLERYGEELVYVFLPDTEEAAKKAEEAETYHLKPTSSTKQGKDGTYRAYMLLRGSKTYDTAEFKRLLDGLLDECKQMGLDVLTEQERALLNA